MQVWERFQGFQAFSTWISIQLLLQDDILFLGRIRVTSGCLFMVMSSDL